MDGINRGAYIRHSFPFDYPFYSFTTTTSLLSSRNQREILQMDIFSRLIFVYRLDWNIVPGPTNVPDRIRPFLRRMSTDGRVIIRIVRRADRCVRAARPAGQFWLPSTAFVEFSCASSLSIDSTAVSLDLTNNS